MDRTTLENLSSKDLHHRAVGHAVRHADVTLLWSLIKAVPVAQAAAGQLDDAETDVVSMSSLLTDLMESDEGEVADVLRPLYIDYLATHND